MRIVVRTTGLGKQGQRQPLHSAISVNAGGIE